jgi:tRNA(Ser,Leu) C12 N-acetylase TAN1
MYELILVRYGELGLKGKNKSQFINRLVQNIKRGIKDLEPREVVSTWGRIWVPVHNDLDQVIERLEKIFGIYSVSPVIKTEKDLDSIKSAALKVLHDTLPQGGTFKVETRRTDKTFPLTSPEISKAVGAYLFANSPDIYQAEMHHPQHTIEVEIRSEGAFVYGQVVPGAKGLPVGSSGRAVLMISDSLMGGASILKNWVISTSKAAAIFSRVDKEGKISPLSTWLIRLLETPTIFASSTMEMCFDFLTSLILFPVTLPTKYNPPRSFHTSITYKKLYSIPGILSLEILITAPYLNLYLDIN